MRRLAGAGSRTNVFCELGAGVAEQEVRRRLLDAPLSPDEVVVASFVAQRLGSPFPLFLPKSTLLVALTHSRLLLVGLKFFRPTRMTGEVHERPRSTTSIVVLKASQLDRIQLSTMGANALVLLVQQRERRGVGRVRELLSTGC